MEELINGRTPEEIKQALKHCSEPVPTACTGCPYNGTCLEHAPEIDDLALIEHLEAERDAVLAKVPKWISVEERLPPPETERYLAVSVCKGGHRITNTAVWAWDENDEKGEWIKWDPVTHWMPMPEPPEEDAYG